MLGLSKSRFHALIRAGVFPKAVLHESCKRPVFDLESQQKCLEIRATGIGLSGQPVIFNRMRANRTATKTAATATEPMTGPHDDHAELVEAMKSLGLTATNEAVAQALIRDVSHGGSSRQRAK